MKMSKLFVGLSYFLFSHSPADCDIPNIHYTLNIMDHLTVSERRTISDAEIVVRLDYSYDGINKTQYQYLSWSLRITPELYKRSELYEVAKITPELPQYDDTDIFTQYGRLTCEGLILTLDAEAIFQNHLMDDNYCLLNAMTRMNIRTDKKVYLTWKTASIRSSDAQKTQLVFKYNPENGLLESLNRDAEIIIDDKLTKSKLRFSQNSIPFTFGPELFYSTIPASGTYCK